MEREPVGRSGAAAESAQTLAYKSVGETDCSSPRRQGDQGQFGLKLANIDGMGLFSNPGDGGTSHPNRDVISCLETLQYGLFGFLISRDDCWRWRI